MARAFPNLTQSEEFSDRGEWSSLRGELVALLDQVEGRYQAEPQPGSDVDGLARRVRDLRSQVGDAPEDDRHRAALRSVKRAVDRFTERDDHPSEQDDLRAAIAEIRGRQGANPSALAPMNFGRRAADQQPMLELSTLVSQLSGRLTGLEGELRAQRSNAGQVREVASQVEQLSHVVELLAGAVGETGQVKRLETQMAGLAKLIETNGKPDLGAVNARLDELSTTMEKLAELQVQQMERDIVRDEQPKTDPQIAPAMQAIENGMRSVYDRIDAMERANGTTNTEFNSELGRIAKLIESREAEPPELARLIGGLVERIDQMEQRTPDAGALRADLEDLGRDVVRVVAPRFEAIESARARKPVDADDRMSRLADVARDPLRKASIPAHGAGARPVGADRRDRRAHGAR
jgi:localization factor PodJL